MIQGESSGIYGFLTQKKQVSLDVFAKLHKFDPLRQRSIPISNRASPNRIWRLNF